MFSRSLLIPFYTYSLVPPCTEIMVKIFVGILKLSRCTPVLTSVSGMPLLPTLQFLLSLIVWLLASLQALSCFLIPQADLLQQWYPDSITFMHFHFCVFCRHDAATISKTFMHISQFECIEPFFSQDHFFDLFPLDQDVHRQSR